MKQVHMFEHHMDGDYILTFCQKKLKLETEGTDFNFCSDQTNCKECKKEFDLYRLPKKENA